MHKEAFKTVARPILARIRRDRELAPRPLKKVFTVVATELFDSSLNAEAAWKAAGIRSHTAPAVFKEATGTSLGQYIAVARIEVARALMATTDLTITEISLAVGYNYPPTFAENYKKLRGKLPSEVVRQVPPPPLIDDARSLEAGRGLLDADEMAAHIKDLLRLSPAAAGLVRESLDTTESAEPRIIVDGARHDQLKAEGLCQVIHDLPFEAQCRQVRRYLFRSRVLFDLLRKKSRQEGGKSRQRGVELAELALVSLEGSAHVFGDRIHDLRALGWAWLGNAHRLALDFSAASAAFDQADREWSQPRVRRDRAVLGHVCNLRGTLRMMRCDYDAATQDLDSSCSLFRQTDQTRAEARALIKRAMIHTYAGKLRQAIGDFREANSLIDEDQEKELAFAVRANLANALVRSGEIQDAEQELDRARELDRAIDDPLGTIKLNWLDGDLSELKGDLEKATHFYLLAREGFEDADELRYYALASVDLMIVYSLQGEWERVGVLAVKTLPILGSLRLHSETLATIGLLAQAVEAKGLSLQLLNDLRAALRRDPLVAM
ncbi:MAG: helix-turn-helix transcriptional regulator [Acidobacteriota bacterium]